MPEHSLLLLVDMPFIPYLSKSDASGLAENLGKAF